MWYIAHHGILGQKHGVRNGPPYPLSAQDHSAAERNAGWRASLKSGSGHNYARKIKKELNRLDTQQSKAIYNRNKAEYQYEKAKAKGKTELAAKRQAEMKGWEDYVRSSEKETWKLIGDAAAAGYDIHSKKAMRDVNYGKRMVAHVLSGILGATAYQAMSVSSSGQSGLVEGNKFNVKRSKYGVPSITIDQRSSKIAESHENYRQKRLEKVREAGQKRALKEARKDMARIEAREAKQAAKNYKSDTKELRKDEVLAKNFDLRNGKLNGKYTDDVTNALEKHYAIVREAGENMRNYEKTHNTDKEKTGGKYSSLIKEYMSAVDSAASDYETRFNKRK